MDQNLQLAEEITQHTSPIASQLSSPPFQVGEKVMVDLFQKEAEIIAIDDVKNEATIIVNGRKVKITYDHLQKKPFSDASLSSNFSLGYFYRPSTPRVSNEIEIRMLKMEEAREKLDKYFDQALLAGYKTIFIIHGKGEGILRKMTHDYLRENPSVESFRLGLPEEGGLGVTVVTLK
jgi:DNA mismatch repair protein MutS2